MVTPDESAKGAQAVKIGLADIQKTNTRNTLFITGAPRSGTSLLGRLIGSLEGVEYHFEPPMIWVLSGLLSMNAIAPDAAAILLQLYLHEDLFVESVHGRRANLRPGDDSLVLNSIGWPELLSRWQGIRNRADAIRYIEEKGLRLALKMPSVIDAIPFFSQALPESKYIIIVRDGRDFARSIIKKGWLSNDGLTENYWPYKEVDGVRVPHMVEDALARQWSGMNAVTRACYLWRRDAQFTLQAQALGLGDRLLVVSYEALRRSPDGTMDQIAAFLATKTTELTRSGIQSVRPIQGGMEQEGYDFLNEAEAHEFASFREANAALGYPW